MNWGMLSHKLFYAQAYSVQRFAELSLHYPTTENVLLNLYYVYVEINVFEYTKPTIQTEW